MLPSELRDVHRWVLFPAPGGATVLRKLVREQRDELRNAGGRGLPHPDARADARSVQPAVYDADGDANCRPGACSDVWSIGGAQLDAEPGASAKPVGSAFVDPVCGSFSGAQLDA